MNVQAQFLRLTRDQLDELRQALAGVQREIGAIAEERAAPAARANAEELTLAARAARIYNERRQRAWHFADAAELFGEPSYDILLDLYIARAARREISVSTVCVGTDAPVTTGLRHVARLVSLGLVSRVADQLDRRRSFLRLTPKAVEQMENFLRRV